MAEMVPVDVSSLSSPMDVTAELEEDHAPGLNNCEYMEKKHPNRLLEGLNRLRLNNTFCDVILCCGGEEFPCHRIVLASFSQYFEAMFTTGMLESRQEKVYMFDMEPQIISALVSFAYTSKVVISTENVQALLAAANQLGVTAVQESCCQYLEGHMDEKNCVGIHCFAQALSCKRLVRRSMDYILENFCVVYQQKEFLALGVDKVTEIFASDDINVPKEETVFMAAVLWLDTCPTRRKESFIKVMKHVRLSLMCPDFLLVVASLVVLVSQPSHRVLLEAKHHRPRWSTLREVILTVGERKGGVGGTAQHRIESYDPLTNQWKTLAPLPIAVRCHGLVVSGHQYVYIAGGDYPDDSPSSEVWRYDSSCDSWSKMASMNEARGDVRKDMEFIFLGLVSLDGYVYAVGGFSRDSLVNSVERYDPEANTWQLMEASVDTLPLSNDCTDPGVVALDGLIYFLDSYQVYKCDPETFEWTEVAPYLVPRTGKAVYALKGKIYVMGGMPLMGYESTAEVECYDPFSNQWDFCASMKERRTGPGLAAVDGKIYAMEGSKCLGLPHHRTMERYCEATESWKLTEKMPVGLTLFGCVSLRMRKDA